MFFAPIRESVALIFRKPSSFRLLCSMASAVMCLAAVTASEPPPDPASEGGSSGELSSKFVTVDGVRMHYLEGGTRGDGPTVLLTHGNPTSSYLWRNIAPAIAMDHHVIALDLVGHGRSDQPDIDYFFRDHIPYFEGFIRELDLKNLVLVGQDWGSGLALDYARGHEANVGGLVLLEAIYRPFDSLDDFRPAFAELLVRFRDPVEGRRLLMDENYFVEKVLPGQMVRQLTDEEWDRYREPFPTPQSRLPLYRWPNELPIAGRPADAHRRVAAYSEWLQRTELPKLLLHATPGALIKEKDVAWFRDKVSNIEFVHLGEGVHHLQEDHPGKVAEAIRMFATAVSDSTTDRH